MTFGGAPIPRDYPGARKTLRVDPDGIWRFWCELFACYLAVGEFEVAILLADRCARGNHDHIWLGS